MAIMAMLLISAILLFTAVLRIMAVFLITAVLLIMAVLLITAVLLIMAVLLFTAVLLIKEIESFVLKLFLMFLSITTFGSYYVFCSQILTLRTFLMYVTFRAFKTVLGQSPLQIVLGHNYGNATNYCNVTK
jgi:hypothetical protein